MEAETERRRKIILKPSIRLNITNRPMIRCNNNNKKAFSAAIHHCVHLFSDVFSLPSLLGRCECVHIFIAYVVTRNNSTDKLWLLVDVLLLFSVKVSLFSFLKHQLIFNLHAFFILFVRVVGNWCKS